ncbi:hypothetical protein C6496_11410 [Candidatus Poribacteria bacterium]|nr:MAG: hypothetical protein C6496_11410 [Candidatus Poribacteria bacterium]
MHQPTNTHRTIKDLSPEELTEYRQRLDQHLQNRKVDEALLQRAWQIAHRVAAMLYKDFGATQVAVFGSLAEQDRFSKGSDIDIAAWGLSGDTYLSAVWETRNFSPEFKIDVINFDSAKGRFREQIEKQAILIQDEQTNSHQQLDFGAKSDLDPEVYKRKLGRRIAENLEDIEQIVEKITQTLLKMDTAPTKYKDACKATLDLYLFRFYARLESIFRRIARQIDMNVMRGRGTHKDLLAQMTEARPLRPSLISQQSVIDLVPFLKFRYRFEHLYHFELSLKETVENAKRVRVVFDQVSEELNAFSTYLENEKND